MTGTVLILDAGMDEETRALAEKVCADYPSVRLEKSPELEKCSAPVYRKRGIRFIILT